MKKFHKIILVVIIIILFLFAFFWFYKYGMNRAENDLQVGDVPQEQSDDLANGANDKSGKVGISSNSNSEDSENIGGSTSSESLGLSTQTASGTNTGGSKVFTAKTGVKIYYPDTYVYSSSPLLGTEERKLCIQQQQTEGKIANGICPPKTNSESITFGPPKTQKERVSIVTSDNDGYNTETCNNIDDGQVTVEQENIQVGSKVVLHTKVPFSDIESFCLVTSHYSFFLGRNISNQIKIDITKIIFP